MRITDLLDKRSIAFDKNPANKQETLDMAVDLMCASVRSMTQKPTENRFT